MIGNREGGDGIRTTEGWERVGGKGREIGGLEERRKRGGRGR